MGAEIRGWEEAWRQVQVKVLVPVRACTQRLSTCLFRSSGHSAEPSFGECSVNAGLP